MLKVQFIQKIACSNIKFLAIIIGYLINKEYCNIKIIRLYFSRCAIDSLTTSKLKFCHFFLLKLFQTCMNCFLLLNTK